MNVVEATDIVRDNLRTNLTDPILTAGGTDRGGEYWIFSDEGKTGSKHPKIEILKLDNPTDVISIGSDYTEYERLFLNIWFYSKNGFKLTISGTEYKNAKLVEYYMGLIKTTLKGQFNTLFDAGFKGYRHINTSKVEYNKETQLYFGAISIRGFYFNT